jgi:hypothetical protein
MKVGLSGGLGHSAMKMLNNSASSAGGSIAAAIGVALGAFAHWVLAGVTPGWIPAAVPLLLALIPVGMYYPVVSRLRLSFADLAPCSCQSRR